MAALVAPGTPISVLLDHGLNEKQVESLNEAGATTVERVSDMTPEQLEEIQGVGPEMVESIQLAVQEYYSQFETTENQEVDGTGEAAAQTAEAAVVESDVVGSDVVASDAVEFDKIRFPDHPQAETVSPSEAEQDQAESGQDRAPEEPQA